MVDGISVKFGAEKGLRANLMLSFSSGENQIDSSEYIYPSQTISYLTYDERVYRPYYWVNYGLRGEYYFTHREWYQTYVGLGLEGKKDSKWISDYEKVNDSTYRNIPKKAVTNYYGPVAVAGINIMPIALFAKLSKLDISFAKALSFNVEVVSFYLLKHDFADDYLINNGWLEYGYYQERKFSGISSGIGIHYNW